MTIDEILALSDFKNAIDILTRDTKEDRNVEELEMKKVSLYCLNL